MGGRERGKQTPQKGIGDQGNIFFFRFLDFRISDFGAVLCCAALCCDEVMIFIHF